MCTWARRVCRTVDDAGSRARRCSGSSLFCIRLHSEVLCARRADAARRDVRIQDARVDTTMALIGCNGRRYLHALSMGNMGRLLWRLTSVSLEPARSLDFASCHT